MRSNSIRYPLCMYILARTTPSAPFIWIITMLMSYFFNYCLLNRMLKVLKSMDIVKKLHVFLRKHLIINFKKVLFSKKSRKLNQISFFLIIYLRFYLVVVYFTLAAFNWHSSVFLMILMMSIQISKACLSTA